VSESTLRATSHAHRLTAEPSAEAPVAIVGAGLAGLVAARELRRRGVPIAVYEAGSTIAGLARSFVDAEGFTYDFGAHFITNRLADAIGISQRCRVVRTYGETLLLNGRRYSYPFGLVKQPRFVASALGQRARGLARSLRGEISTPASAADWFRAEYGPRLADEIALPLLEAWSGIPASKLAPSVGEKMQRGVLHALSLRLASRVMRRAIANGYCREKPESIRVWHVYPEGSLGSLCDHLAQGLDDAIHLESPVEAIYVEDERVTGLRVAGRDVAASAVLSTAPVHILARLVKGTTALEPLRRFRYRAMVFVNLRLEGRRLLPDIVTWTPDPQLPFFRLTEAPIAMPWLAPAGKTVITVDLGCDVGDAIWTMEESALTSLVLEHLERIVPGVRGRLLGARVLRTPVAYPVFLREYEADRQRFERSTGVEGLMSIGRNGEFAHLLMEDVYWRTMRRVDELLTAR